VRVFQRIRQRLLPNVEQVFFDSRRKIVGLANDLKFRLQRSARSRVFYDRVKCIGKSSFLERLRSKRVHRPTRFTQTVAGEFTRSTDVTNSMLGIFLQECFFGSLHLNDHAGEPLSERIVNVSRHAGSLFENGRLTLLLDELLAVRRHHDVVSEGLSKFDFIRSIGPLFRMMNTDKPAKLPGDKHRYGHESLASVALQVLAEFRLDTCIPLNIVDDHRRFRKQQFLQERSLFPPGRIIRKRMI
jgi:hypothetical protein